MARRKKYGHRLEADAVESILEYAKNRPRLLLWRQPVLRAKIRGRWLQGGVQGQPDFTGVLKTPFGGLRIDVEAKSATGTIRELQEKYRDRVREYSSIYIVARTPAEIEAVIRPIEQTLWELSDD